MSDEGCHSSVIVMLKKMMLHQTVKYKTDYNVLVIILVLALHEGNKSYLALLGERKYVLNNVARTDLIKSSELQVWSRDELVMLRE